MEATTIETLVKSIIPTSCFTDIRETKGAFGGRYIKIFFAAIDYNINNVRGQKPQAVSLILDLGTMELEAQIFGGNGGRCLYRDIDVNDPNEKYLAMARIKIPFRKPQKTEKAILTAVEKFAKNWVALIRENKDKLKYRDIVDYSIF